MLESASVQVAVVHCFADPDVLDTLQPPEGAMKFRIAPGEAICIAARTQAANLAAALSAALERMDPYALALDRSDAWSMFTLSGSDRARAFARLCTTPLPSSAGFLQGEIGGVPAKAIVLNDRIDLMVSSVLAHHLRQRILEACADLSPREAAATEFAMAASWSQA